MTTYGQLSKNARNPTAGIWSSNRKRNASQYASDRTVTSRRVRASRSRARRDGIRVVGLVTHRDHRVHGFGVGLRRGFWIGDEVSGLGIASEAALPLPVAFTTGRVVSI